MRILKKHNDNSLKRTIEETQSTHKETSSLQRIESQKELPNITSKKTLTEKHAVKEELVIMENINDSSCTIPEQHPLPEGIRHKYIVEKDCTDDQVLQPENVNIEIKEEPAVSVRMIEITEVKEEKEEWV